MYTLKNIPLFSGLNDEHLTRLEKLVHIRHYTKDSIVFYEGDESTYIHILFEGSVKLYKTSPSGKEVYLHSAKASSVVALGPALQNRPFPASCSFENDGVMGTLKLESFYICLESLECTVEMITTMAMRLKELERMLHRETIFSSEAKVADFILKNSNLFQRLKNNEIARILNLTPETFSRILSKLKQHDIIVIDNHKVSILNRNALDEILETNCMKKESIKKLNFRQ